MSVTIGDIGMLFIMASILLMFRYDVEYWSKHDEFKRLGEEEGRGI